MSRTLTINTMYLQFKIASEVKKKNTLVQGITNIYNTKKKVRIKLLITII